MSAIRLERVNAAEGMARFYLVDVQPSLFGWSSVYEWGRIGRPGQVQVRVYDSESEARAATVKKLRDKIKSGYTMQSSTFVDKMPQLV